MKSKNFKLEEKDIYKLFNYVKMDEKEANDFKEDVSESQKEKIKKNLNKRIKRNRRFKVIKYSSVAAAAALVFIIGIGTVSPAFAKNIPILNSITQTLNDKFGFNGDYAKYSQSVNRSASYGGVTITINEVLADDSKVILGYTIKSKKKINDLEVSGFSRFLKINGKMLSGSNGSSTGSYENDNTYVGTEEIHTKLPQDTENYNIALKVEEIGNIKGHWNIAFTASKRELVKASKVIKPNLKLKFPDSNISVDKVTLSPIDTSIDLSGKSKYKDSSSELCKYDYWIAFDDRGIELIPKGLGGGSRDLKTGIFTSEMDYVSLKKLPKYITIVPCRIIPSAGGGVQLSKNGKETPIKIKTKKPKEVSQSTDVACPIELKQGSMGKIIINEIEKEKDKTIVKYTAEGKAPYFQAQDILIKDSKGNDIDIKDYVKRSDKNPNEFTKVFEALKPNEKYVIYTNDFSNVEFRDDLKFNIKIK
ncbi:MULTISPECIES: DUF4179 domain-containing protein [Clostridium]|uniref:DUF4179 domain-containing protein n=1 Tax=Clostridium TaxID=1485 RepID=UPI000823FAE5|nr:MULTISPECIES: DUF4179 domain-containing protein [Clostridium]PJI09793.1 DUF4179 domain-containing protein [Clostridium sp. CT7]